jgi:hypothetical protein
MASDMVGDLSWSSPRMRKRPKPTTSLPAEGEIEACESHRKKAVTKIGPIGLCGGKESRQLV